MLSPVTEKKFLQCVVALGCLVPLGGGFYGMTHGVHGDINLDSHFRYLSGLLLGIGVAFTATIPRIERYAMRFRMLTFIVMVGGLGRLAGVMLLGLPSPSMAAALVMELGVTPLLCLWQNRVARRFL